MKILFVSNLNLTGKPQGGGQFKSLLLLSMYSEIPNSNFKTIDTFGYKLDYRIIFKLLYNVFYKNYDIIIVSTATKSADRLFSLMALLGHKLLEKVIYHPQGMYIEEAIVNGHYSNNKYKSLNLLYLESIRAVDVFNEKGINAIFFPNTKVFDLDKTYVHFKETNEIFWNFIFVSRISTDKGVFVILEALKKLQIQNQRIPIKMDFYGPIDEEIKIEFESKINNLENVSYCGYLDLFSDFDSSYDLMSNYDLMVLPTFWKGEGIAGAFIDAFIAGLPILTTSWNVNEEIIKDNYNGWIIPPNDINALVEKINFLSKDIKKLNEMKKNAFNSRVIHHEKIVSENLINDIQIEKSGSSKTQTRRF